jgi:hypothetical protein
MQNTEAVMRFLNWEILRMGQLILFIPVMAETEKLERSLEG